MKRTIKRSLALLLALALCLGLLPGTALAAELSGVETGDASLDAGAEQQEANEEENQEGVDAPQVYQATEVCVNPLYADVIDESDLLQPVSSSGAVTLDDSEYYTSTADAGAEMRAGMKQRQETIVVKFQADAYSSELVHEISDQAMKHTGNPTEGDYLRWQYAGWKTSTSYHTSNSICYMTITYTVTYYTTSEQEQEMDAAVADVLAQLDVSAAGEYAKICAVYDYICAHTTYDYDNLEDDSYKLKYTAYAALINGTAVCQGYAVLLYRLALELGVDARLIAGIGNGGAHGWNIVKVDGQYYNADSTWDAGRSSYSYFLKCDANFGNHTRNEEYTTEEFYAAYPMGAEDYVPAAEPEYPVSGTCGDNLTWTLDKDGTLTVSGVGAMEMCPQWDGYKSEIKRVVLQDGVASVGEEAFANCTNLTNVTFSDTVTSIDTWAFYNCTSLANVIIPNGLISIGAESFYNCTSLASVTIPDSVTGVGSEAFGYCDNLTEVNASEEWLDSIDVVDVFVETPWMLARHVVAPQSVAEWEDIGIKVKPSTSIETELNVSVSILDNDSGEYIPRSYGFGYNGELDEDGYLTVRLYEVPAGNYTVKICLTGAGTNNFSATLRVYSLEEMLSLLSEGETLTVNGDMKLIGDAVVPANRHLVVKGELVAEASLTVEANASLTTEELEVTSELELNGTATSNYFSADEDMTITGNGTLIVKTEAYVPLGFNSSRVTGQSGSILVFYAGISTENDWLQLEVCLYWEDSQWVIKETPLVLNKECSIENQEDLENNGGYLPVRQLYGFTTDKNGTFSVSSIAKNTGTITCWSVFVLDSNLNVVLMPVSEELEHDNDTDADLGFSINGMLNANGKYYLAVTSAGASKGWLKFTADYSGGLASEETQENPFTDVKESEYYYDAVMWAYSNGIASGVTSTTFRPEASCTRAQMVTFLWRAMGEPEPETTENPFTDVKASEYYYKAVLWAYENGIAAGMSSTTFQPDTVITRGQVVTFLWRAEGKPEATIENPFTDVKSGEYYYDAVLWAYENGITSGATATLFKPSAACTRGQVVTFLYRDMGQ